METIACALQLPTATISDAMDAYWIGGVVNGLTRRSGSGRPVGYVWTLCEHVRPLGRHQPGEFSIGSVFDDTDSQTVLAVEMSGEYVQTMGGLASLIAALKQCADVVLDGGCRDIEDVRATGLTVASRFVTPRTGKRRVRVLALDEPVTCGGVTVS